MVGGDEGVVTWVTGRAKRWWIWRLGLSIDVGELDEDDGCVWGVGDRGAGYLGGRGKAADVY